MLTADFSAKTGKIKKLCLDSGKILFEKAREVELSITSYTANDVLNYFFGQGTFPFRNEDFKAQLQNRIGVLQVPTVFNLSVGLYWVRYGLNLLF